MKQYLVRTNFLSKSYEDSAVLVDSWYETFEDALAAYVDDLRLHCVDEISETVRVDVFKAVGRRFVKLASSYELDRVLWGCMPEDWRRIKGECKVDGWFWATNNKKGKYRCTALIYGGNNNG